MELSVLLCFAEQRPANQVAIEYDISYQKVARIFRDVRELLFHQCELEGKKLSGEIEIDEAYFGVMQNINFTIIEVFQKLISRYT